MRGIASMTGFARTEGRADGFGWAWELRSVNSKTLDLRFRLPTGWEDIELPCRQAASEALARGAVTASLVLDEGEQPRLLRINEPVLAQIVETIKGLEGRVDAAPPRLDGLLAIRGVLELVEDRPSDALRAARRTMVQASFREALAALGAARVAEGERLGRVLAQRLDEIARLKSEAEGAAATQPAEIAARFRRQLAALTEMAPAAPEERVAQELALLVSRADIREELDRLDAHILAARELMAEATAIGRKFDFLCQEFNREANTVCSKSADLGLTKVGLALKAAIEQLREQVQNIE